jgi:hypothetical protein
MLMLISLSNDTKTSVQSTRRTTLVENLTTVALRWRRSRSTICDAR